MAKLSECILTCCEKSPNKRMLSDWFSAALQTSRKCGRYAYLEKQMYIWNTGKLVAELKKNSLTEENFKNYYLATSILYLIGFYAATLSPPNSLSALTLEAIGSIGITIFGLNLAFNANKGNDGVCFLSRIASISFPLLIKLLIISIFLGILLVVLEELSVTQTTSEWVYSCSTLLLQLWFFWRLIIHIKILNA